MMVHESPSMLIPILLTVVAAVTYVALAVRNPRGRRWSRGRTAAFVGGCALLVLGFSPRALPFADGDFRKHMLQHLLLGMICPIGLVMGAPVSLVLRSFPSRYGRVLMQVVRARIVRFVANPFVALLLELGGMAALYFTPLYSEMAMHPVLHCAVHFHFVAAGCLYAWVIAGPDPAPERASVRTRLLVLGIAIVVHSVMAQMLYAGWHVAVSVPAWELERGAELMYYGGDVAEMMLAFALVSSWRPAGDGRVLRLI